jgi:hypothetical protein
MNTCLINPKLTAWSKPANRYLARLFPLCFPIYVCCISCLARRLRILVLVFVVGLMVIEVHAQGPARASFDPKTIQRYFDVKVADPDQFSSGLTTTNTRITLKMITGRDTPEQIAVFVGAGEHADPRRSDTRWMPFREKLDVELGEVEGDRSIFVAARWKATDRGYEGSGFDVTVSRTPPVVWIIRPTELVTSKPIIQLQGRATKPLLRCSYDLLDQNGKLVRQDEDGGAGGNYPGGDPKADFTCFDVELTPGTNTFVLRCTDEAGLTTTTNFIVVFSTAGDTNPPVFKALHFPGPGMSVGGERFTVRGLVDDYTAKLAGQLIGGGQTNHIEGYAGRNGYFWYEDLPLIAGPNHLTLTATDHAGNTSRTNLMFVGVHGPVVTLDEILPAQKLWESHITVTGKLTPSNYRLLVNGVAATVKSDGSWSAHKVPAVSVDGGGVATFDFTILPLGPADATSASPQERLLTHARMTNQPLTLNASRPACGVFQLHVADTAKQPFILFSSTNLVDWIPILTNHNPAATFDYIDTNVSAHGCRFFQIRPLK